MAELIKKPLLEYLSTSSQKTKLYGKNLAKNLKKGSIVCFFGDLGAGKTTLIKGLVSELNNTKEINVTSPTFTYLNIYPGKLDVYHFDLYRIKDDKQFLNMGFDEYFEKDGVCLIEWAEKITPIIPSRAVIVHLLSTKKETDRQIVILEL